MKKKEPREAYGLGIESTADDFSVGISTFDGMVLAHVIDAFMPLEGGRHPREAARHHAEVASVVLDEAFQKSGIAPRDLSIFSFCQGCGLGP